MPILDKNVLHEQHAASSSFAAKKNANVYAKILNLFNRHIAKDAYLVNK